MLDRKLTTKLGPTEILWQFSISLIHSSVVEWSSVASSRIPHLMSATYTYATSSRKKTLVLNHILTWQNKNSCLCFLDIDMVSNIWPISYEIFVYLEFEAMLFPAEVLESGIHICHQDIPLPCCICKWTDCTVCQEIRRDRKSSALLPYHCWIFHC